MTPFQHALLAENIDIIDIASTDKSLIYTWFGRPNYAYSEEAQKYWIGTTGYSAGIQHVTEYDIESDTYTTVEVGSVPENDDHNQAQILIRSSDKRLFICYTSHHDSAIRYRISVNPLDGTEWGAEQTIDPGGADFSYPSPYEDANGNIFIFYRQRIGAGGAGDHKWSFCKSTDGGVTFGAGIGYWKTYGNKNLYNVTCQSDIDNNIIHFTATDQHISISNKVAVDIWHFYFDCSNETFYSSDGVAQSLPMGLSLTSKIVDTTTPDSSWLSDVNVKDGKPRVLYYLYPEGVNNDALYKDLYFMEWKDNGWTTPRFIVRELDGYIEDDETINSIGYPPVARFDTKNKDIVWSAIEVNGILEMHKIELLTNYFEQLTFDSEFNNWRPISVPSPINNLIWIKNNDYNAFTSWSSTLQTKTVPV